MKKIITSRVWLFILFSSLALQVIGQKREEGYTFWNETMQQIALPSSNERWIDINPEARIKTESFFVDYASALGLGTDDKMHLFNAVSDTLGYKHFFYHQYYKNVRIEDGQYHLHVDKHGVAYLANGTLKRNLNKTEGATLSSTEALQKVLGHVNAVKYLWEDKYFEERLKADHLKDTSYYPVGELIWVNMNPPTEQTTNYNLAYVFEIHCYQPLTSKKVYISAVDGRILKEESMERSCGYANYSTVYNGTQTVGVSVGYVQLWNDCINIRTREWNNDCNTNPGADADIHPYSSAQVLGIGVQTHWGLDKAYYYYSNKFNRDGYDGSHGHVEAMINAYWTGSPGSIIFGCSCSNTNSNNASFNPSTGICMVGHGCTYVGNSDSYSALDIIAHEFAHGVTGHNNSGGLNYSYESGALNESFSDIFGECVENHATGSNNWLIGYDRSDGALLHFPMRSMSNPYSYDQPSVYGGTYWYTGSNDNGGVHTNSGVQNKMFYLLATSIGLSAAENIAYKALTSGYFVPTSNYADARRAWIRAAVDLYGSCSNQATQTMDAWTNVGVYQQSTPSAVGVCGVWPTNSLSQTSFSNYSIQCPPPACSSTTIITSSSTFFKANGITLLPGFTAFQGCNFTASIETCPFPY